jgi:hypothetical protein
LVPQGQSESLPFTYDDFGNRTNEPVTKGSGPSVLSSINLATNRINGSGYTHEANGNLTAMLNVTFLGRLESMGTLESELEYVLKHRKG